MLFAADKGVSKNTGFVAASAALIVGSALGVLAVSFLCDYINENYLRSITELGFTAIGAVTLYNA